MEELDVDTSSYLPSCMMETTDFKQECIDFLRMTRKHTATRVSRLFLVFYQVRIKLVSKLSRKDLKEIHQKIQQENDSLISSCLN